MSSSEQLIVPVDFSDSVFTKKLERFAEMYSKRGTQFLFGEDSGSEDKEEEDFDVHSDQAAHHSSTFSFNPGQRGIDDQHEQLFESLMTGIKDLSDDETAV